MTNTVSPETGRRLAAAGFPQPAPAPGQWWGDETKLVLIWRKWEGNSKYYTVIIDDAIEPAVEYYFDLQDFTGLVYLPTVGDIFKELGAWKYLHIRDSVFMVSRDSDLGTLSHIAKHEHHAEAAALGYLSIHEKSKT